MEQHLTNKVSALESRTASLLGYLKRFHLRRRQRQLLLSLGDDALKDIGLSRVDALAEGEKPFWQP